MTITLYEYPPTRSARVRWTLQELDAPFESVSDRRLFGSKRLKKVHPLGKFPAVEDAGRPLFESAAICTWLADKHADRGLGHASGTWDRALHDQWVSFVLSELEAHMWSTFRNTVIYPDDKKVPAIIAQNDAELARALPVLEDYLSGHDYLVDDRFSVTDIITVFTTNWVRKAGHLESLPNLNAYTLRLMERPHCPYSKD
jgi:glutathione S-transferase